MTSLISDPAVAAATLSVLTGAGRPIGARALRGALAERGFTISEPTAARLLQAFDRLGFTLPQGRSGRIVTALGREQLTHLEASTHRDRSARQFLDAVRAMTLPDVINVLSARRAIKREMARSAALNATPHDLAELRAERLRMIQTGTTEGSHDLLSRAAHNPVLEAMYQLINDDPRFEGVFVRLNVQHGQARSVSFTLRLIDAIERRDPETAEAVSVAYFDEMTALLTELWSLIAQDIQGSDVVSDEQPEKRLSAATSHQRST